MSTRSIIVLIISVILIIAAIIFFIKEEDEKAKEGNLWNSSVWQASNEFESVLMLIIALGAVMAYMALTGII